MTHTLPEDQKESIMEFPCEFSIKAMGRNHDCFDGLVASLVRVHVPELSEGAVRMRPSKANNFIAVTVTFTATSRPQLDAIYQSLSDHPDVLMAL